MQTSGGSGGQEVMLLLSDTGADLSCPICMSILNDPFVTSCGHTFCYNCISTHLQNSKNCPSCSGFLSKELIYPNFLLSKIAKNAHENGADAKLSTFGALQRAISITKGRLSPSEIDQLITTLHEAKQAAEHVDQRANMELLLHFLHHSREEKLRKLQALKNELLCLDSDIGKVEITTGGGGGALTAGAAAANNNTATSIEELTPQQQQQQQSEGGGHTTPSILPPPAIGGGGGGAQQQTSLPTTTSGGNGGTGNGLKRHLSMQGMQQAALAMAHYQQGSTVEGTQLPPATMPPNRIAGGTAAATPPNNNNNNNNNGNNSQIVGNDDGGGVQPQRQSSTIPQGINAATVAVAPVGNRTTQAAAAAAAVAAYQLQQQIDTATGTATGDIVTGNGQPLGGQPSTRGVLGLLKNKKRRIASQFDDLQSAYLRLRASQLAGGGGGGRGSADEGGGATTTTNPNNNIVPAGAIAAQEQQISGGGSATDPSSTAMATAAAAGAIVDDGLHEFSRMLAVLMKCNKLKVLAEIPRPSLRQSSSIISSIEFDRDGVLFATAGVSKRISIFEYASVVGNSGVSVHCPIVELVTRSKLSCLSWNRYITSHLASSDYEGVITLWDVHSSAMVQEYEAHTKRIWSVDFCDTDPTLLASGSDDCAVKLWSTRASCCVSQLDLKANVCAVAWRPGSQHEIAVGSADHAVYLYDLRKPSQPTRTCLGHRKAVSYVRWCDGEQLASASTDSTLRLWSRVGKDGEPAERIYEGHVNEKNFVGLAADGDFLACGSESNEAFVYYRALSKPIARQGFTEPTPGGDAATGGGGGRSSDVDRSAFISAVCWRPKVQQLLVANSQGNVRVMELTGADSQ